MSLPYGYVLAGYSIKWFVWDQHTFNISRRHSIYPTVCEKHDFENNPFPYRKEMLKYESDVVIFFPASKYSGGSVLNSLEVAYC